MEALHNMLKSIHEKQTTINSFISFQFPIFFSWRTISLNSQPFLPNNISFVYPPRSFHLKALHSSIPPKHISWLTDKILIKTRVQCTAQTSHFSS
jgi:hypothetical protein